MTIHQEKELLDLIELQIDKHGLAAILQIIADICVEKEQHLLATWQDNTIAGIWRKYGLKLTKIVESLINSNFKDLI